MKSFFLSAAAAVLLGLAGQASAATTAGSSGDNMMAPIFRAPADDVDPSFIITHAGNEWVWAAPCAAEQPSCGAPTPMYGFDNPTQDQWATWADRAELITAFTDGSGNAICASAYFGSGYSHCDMGDATIGAIWHAYANGICDPAYCDNSNSETFYVRAVPEPETYALMIAGLGLVGFMVRRRRLHRG